MPSAFPYSPVRCEWSWKKTQKNKVDIAEKEVKYWQNVMYYFMDGFLKMLPHIRIRLIKSSFDLLLYKTL